MSGDGRPGGRRAAVIDVTAAVLTLVVTALVCLGLGLAGWLSVLIGGCLAAAGTRLRPGARLTGSGRRDGTE